MMVESRSGASTPVHAPPPDQADRIAAGHHAAPSHVSHLQWQLATPAERHALAGQRAPTSPPGATGFRGEVTGTQPRPGVDRQMALLANDAYAPMPTPQPPGPEDDGHMTTTAYRRELAAAGWQRVDPASLGIDKRLAEDPRSGFQAAIYRNDRNQYVVAFAGTDVHQFGDVKTDLGQGIGIDTSQYDHAVKLARQVQHEVGAGNLAFTGHSLGGGLAATAAAATREPAVTFNAAGVHDETLRGLGYANPNDAREAFAGDGSIRSYAVAGDPLTTLGVRGAPGQLGTPWTMPLPDGKGLSVNDLRDLKTLHGGGDSGQLYVDGLAPDAKPLRPGIVQTPVIEAALRFGPLLPGGALLGGPVLAFGQLPPAGRAAALGVAGAAGDAAKAFHGDAIDVGRRYAGDVADISRHRDAADGTRLAGAGLHAQLDLAGSVLHRGADFLGHSVTAFTDAAGTQVRSAGHALHLPEPIVHGAAHAIEHAGNAERRLLEAGGQAAERVAHGAGRVAAGAANALAHGEEAAAKAAVHAGRAAGHAAVHGAVAAAHAADSAGRAVGHAAVHTARAAASAGHAAVHAAVRTARGAAHAVAHAATAAGHAAAHGASVVGHAVAHAATAAGHGAVKAARTVGHAVAHAAGWTTHAAANAARFVEHRAVSAAGSAVHTAGQAVGWAQHQAGSLVRRLNPFSW